MKTIIVPPLKVPTFMRAEYSCRLCGKTTPLDFRDPAAYNEPEPMLAKGRWAEEQALATAKARLEKRARKALKLVRCPACRARDPRLLRRALFTAALPLIGVAPGIFMVGVIATSLLFPAATRAMVYLPVLVGTAMLLGAAPIIILRRRKKMIDETDRAVSFLPQPEDAPVRALDK